MSLAILRLDDEKSLSKGAQRFFSSALYKMTIVPASKQPWVEWLGSGGFMERFFSLRCLDNGCANTMRAINLRYYYYTLAEKERAQEMEMGAASYFSIASTMTMTIRERMRAGDIF